MYKVTVTIVETYRLPASDGWYHWCAGKGVGMCHSPKAALAQAESKAQRAVYAEGRRQGHAKWEEPYARIFHDVEMVKVG